MFAVSGRRADAQDLVHRLSAFEFAADDAELVFDRTKRRNDLQLHAVTRRRLAQARPRARGARREELFAALRVEADGFQMRRLAHAAQPTRATIIARHAEGEGIFDQAGCRRWGHFDSVPELEGADALSRPALRSASRSTYSICALTLRSSSSAQRCTASRTSALMRSG